MENKENYTSHSSKVGRRKECNALNVHKRRTDELNLAVGEVYIKKLIYRSWHRGCKEMDILLGTYAKQNLWQLTPGDLCGYEALLECDDNDIYDWITGKQAVPTSISAKIIKDVGRCTSYASE